MLFSRRKDKLSGKNAFTLVEVLLTMTIFAFIGAGIAMSFFSGVKLWQRATTTDFWRNDIILNLESVSKQLRQSLNISSIGFEGDAKSFSFPALSGDKIIKAVYSFESGSKTLKRSEYAMKDLMNDEKAAGIAERNVANFDEFSVQYLKIDSLNNSVEWADSWSKEDGIYTAIRLKGRSHNEEFQKTIFIPVAPIAQ